MTGSVIKGQIQREDLSQFDGKTLSASRANSSGGTQTGTRLGNAVDVKTLYGGSANVGALQKAIDTLGSTNCALEFTPETWTIDANVTVPANFTLVVPAGCVFAISAGITLTNNGVLFRQHATYSSGSGTFTQSGTDLLASTSDTQTNIYAIDAGTTDAFAITTGASISSLSDGDCFRFQASSANTGACTLNVDAVGAKDIRTFGNRTALPANAILNDGIYTVIYDAANDVFQLQQQPATSYIEGLLDDATAGAARTTLGIDFESLAALTALADADKLHIYDDDAAAYKGITVANARSELSELSLITSGTVSSAASLDLTNLSSTYAAYLLVIDDWIPATDAVDLLMRTSSDNGSNFDAGASDYAGSNTQVNGNGTPTDTATDSGQFTLSGTTQGNSEVGQEWGGGMIWIFNPTDANSTTFYTADYSHQQAGGTFSGTHSWGQRLAVEANDAIQLKFSSGNISTGNYTLYGLRA